MHILHVYKDYPPILGGIENHIQMVARAQAARGHQVTVLVTDPGGLPRHAVHEGVHIIRAARLATVASTPLSLTFPWHLARLRPDITHLHFPYPPGEISQWLVGRGRPYVITYHSDVINPRQQLVLRLYRPLLWRVLRGAARLLPTSPPYIRSSPFLAPLADRCTVVPLGIDPTPFLKAAPHPCDLPAPRLLFVGRHRYYKGLEVLLQALPQVTASLLVVGDGPMRSAWEALARRLGLMERVRFLGEVPPADLPGWYATADVFVLPATLRAEAFGTVLLEAMAAGLPCVTTELGTGTSFVVRDGETGLVVPAKDVQALATALRRLLDDNTALRRRMGQAGRERVLRHFTLEHLVDNLDAVYRAVLEEEHGEQAFALL